MNEDNKNSKYFLLSICAVFLLVVIFSFYSFFIRKNYEVTKQIDCDPKIDSCFVSDCESNDSTCDASTTYKKIYVLSKYASNDYENLSCSTTSTFCRIVTCKDSTIESGEKCFK